MMPRNMPAPVRTLGLLWALLAVAIACATLGDSFEQRLADAYETNADVRAAATRLLNSEQISSGAAVDILEITDRTRGILDAAKRASAAGDMSTALGLLGLAAAINAELMRYAGD